MDHLTLLQSLGKTQSIWLPAMVLFASLLGSWHCAAMCGGLVTSVCSTQKSWWAYQIGRLFAYLFLGLVAIFLGRYALQNTLNGILPWVISLGFILTFIAMGIQVFIKKTLFFNPFAFLMPYFSKTLQEVKTSSKFYMRFLPGFLSAFLPCAWLYGFVLAAAATQSFFWGSLILFFFWLGGLPALKLMPLVLQRSFFPLQKYAPKLSALLFILVGALTLSLKISQLYTLSFSSLKSQSEVFCPVSPPK